MRRGCNIDHGLRRLHSVFVVFAETAIASEPSEAPLHDPGQARDLECALPSFNDLQFPAVSTQDLTSQLATLMSSVSHNDANVGKEGAQATQQKRSRSSIGNVGRLDSTRDRQTQHVDENVTLASFHSFVRIEATNPAAFRCLYRLPVHDDHRRARGPADLPAHLLIYFAL